MGSPSRDIDLLLINPGGGRKIYQNLSTNLSAKEPPIWVGLLAEHARRQGLSVQVLDANAFDLDGSEVADRVAEFNPQLCAVVVYGHNPNASTHVMPAAGEICSAIKVSDPQQPVLLLGGHVAALPERTLREEAADFTCSGEGPQTITNLVAALRANETSPDLPQVPGLVWMEGDVVVSNAPAPLVTDLENEMPGMAWDLLPMREYRAHNWHCYGGLQRQPYAAIYTTLGCPFQCTFCCIQAPFKSGEEASGFKAGTNSYRRFAAANVIAQVRRLVREFGVTNLKIADEIFLLDKAHVGAICDGLIDIQAEENVELNIWAYARIDTCNDLPLMTKMRAAGIRWLALGIESASEHVRADVDKGYRPDRVLGAVQRVRDAGIYVMGNYIFGLPEDDAATMRQTLDFAKELNTEFANFFSAMAYPGSQLYRDALARGWQLPDTWNGYSQHSNSCLPLPTKHVSGSEVLTFRDQAFVEYFDRPEYMAMAQATFGTDTVREIEGMLAQPLARQHAAAVTTSATPPAT